FDRLQRLRRGIRLVHIGVELPEELLDAASRGQVIHVDRISQLNHTVQGLIYRRAPVLRHQSTRTTVSWRAAKTQYPLLELSNTGFSFQVGIDQEVEDLLPGSVLFDVQMSSEGTLALSGIAAVIRHVSVETEPIDHYRVGCEIRPTNQPRTREPVHFIRDR